MKANVSRFITGLVIIAVGFAFLLGNFHIFNFNEFLRDWWPMFIVLGGVLIFINDVKSYLWALLTIGFGIVLQLKELGITDVNPWQLFWPVVIIFVGLSVLLNRSAARFKVSKADRDDATAILGGSDQKNTSDNFKGAKATAVMGGVKLDLRKATIKKEASIEIFSFWGGVEIIVPRDVVVKNQISAILGGVEDKTDQDATKNAPVLYITGDVIMAGVEIKN